VPGGKDDLGGGGEKNSREHVPAPMDVRGFQICFNAP